MAKHLGSNKSIFGLFLLSKRLCILLCIGNDSEEVYCLIDDDDEEHENLSEGAELEANTTTHQETSVRRISRSAESFVSLPSSSANHSPRRSAPMLKDEEEEEEDDVAPEEEVSSAECEWMGKLFPAAELTSDALERHAAASHDMAEHSEEISDLSRTTSADVAAQRGKSGRSGSASHDGPIGGNMASF